MNAFRADKVSLLMKLTDQLNKTINFSQSMHLSDLTLNYRFCYVFILKDVRSLGSIHTDNMPGSCFSLKDDERDPS